jgi:hypothetical protein
MRQLVGRYDTIRKNLKSGPQRTREMTDVVRHLTILADKLDDVDWSRYLRSRDGGERIAAYSYLYARPHPDVAPELVRTLTTIENQPFGQYWAILALGKIADIFPMSVRRLIPKLEGFLAKLQPGTDRYYELSRLIDNLDSAA